MEIFDEVSSESQYESDDSFLDSSFNIQEIPPCVQFATKFQKSSSGYDSDNTSTIGGTPINLDAQEDEVITTQLYRLK